jgi:hypothetical protein
MKFNHHEAVVNPMGRHNYLVSIDREALNGLPFNLYGVEPCFNSQHPHSFRRAGRSSKTITPKEKREKAPKVVPCKIPKLT